MKMKRKTITAGIAVAVIAAACAAPHVSTRLFAANTAPGTADDPLVSRSYVDEKINQVLAVISNGGSGNGGNGNVSDAAKAEIVAEVMSQLEYYYASRDGGAAAATFTPVLLKAGQTMVGGEGTEIIPRSGRSVAYSAVPDGVSDVTDGVDITNGNALKLNHMLVIARADGRGVRAVSDAWVLVKGAYTIQ